MVRALFALPLLLSAGCTTLPQGSTTWNGHTPGRIKVRMVSDLPTLPPRAWIVKAAPENASGYVRYVIWHEGKRYSLKDYFQVQDSWDLNIGILGRLETQDGSIQLCAVNPTHGGFMEGDSFVITHSYDQCAPLSRR